ncbi:MAG: DUF4405 domain-containing protein [Acidobacteria bacterium]|nr:DUF4405 domain-containing protein [Acidobacteriota bacterium]
MRKKSGFHLRAYVSTFLGFSGLVLLVSGIVLYIAPPGRVAHWVNWRFLGGTKEQWIEIHTILSFLFVAIGIWHLVYNWKPFIHYLKGKTSSMLRWRRESATALLTVVLIGALAMLDVPPLSYVSDLGEMASNAWEAAENKPVIPHAEKLTLKAYSKAAGIPLEQMMKKLASLGYPAKETETIADIGKKLKMAPMALAEIFARAPHSSEGVKVEPEPGTSDLPMGKLSLSAYSNRTGIPVRRFINRLAINGYRAVDTEMIGDIAKKLNTSPAALIELFSRPPQSDPKLKRAEE